MPTAGRSSAFEAQKNQALALHYALGRQVRAEEEMITKALSQGRLAGAPAGQASRWAANAKLQAPVVVAHSSPRRTGQWRMKAWHFAHPVEANSVPYRECGRCATFRHRQRWTWDKVRKRWIVSRRNSTLIRHLKEQVNKAHVLEVSCPRRRSLVLKITG